MQFGILPHQLVECSLREFIFDMSILSEKKEINNEERKAREEWLKEMEADE